MNDDSGSVRIKPEAGSSPLCGGLKIKGLQKQSEKGKPLVSIITVVLNRRDTVKRAIKSVLGQNYHPLEYIVIDGGSTDGTLDIIRTFNDDIDLWISEPDEGMYFALNKGIRLSNGELIGIVHSDDFLFKENVVQQIVEASQASDEEIIHGNMVEIIENEKFCSFNKVIPDSDKILETHRCMNHPSCFFRKSVFLKSGLYDTKYRSAADYEFFIRCVKNGHRFHYLDIVVTGFSNQRTGRVSANCRSHLEAYRFHKKHETGNHRKYLLSFADCMMRKYIKKISRIRSLTC